MGRKWAVKVLKRTYRKGKAQGRLKAVQWRYSCGLLRRRVPKVGKWWYSEGAQEGFNREEAPGGQGSGSGSGCSVSLLLFSHIAEGDIFQLR